MDHLLSKYIGASIPTEVSKRMHAHRIGIMCQEIVKAIFVVQATKQHLTAEQRKYEAEQIVLHSHAMFSTGILGQSKVNDEYVAFTMLPAFIDGIVKGLNLSLFIDSSSPHEVGGMRSDPIQFTEDKKLSKTLFMSGAQPKAPVPAPKNLPTTEGETNV